MPLYKDMNPEEGPISPGDKLLDETTGEVVEVVSVDGDKALVEGEEGRKEVSLDALKRPEEGTEEEPVPEDDDGQAGIERWRADVMGLPPYLDNIIETVSVGDVVHLHKPQPQNQNYVGETGVVVSATESGIYTVDIGEHFITCYRDEIEILENENPHYRDGSGPSRIARNVFAASKQAGATVSLTKLREQGLGLEEMVENIIECYFSLPEEMRPESESWYDDTREYLDSIVERHPEYTRDQIYAVTSAISPRFQWHMNIGVVEMIVMYHKAGNRDTKSWRERDVTQGLSYFSVESSYTYDPKAERKFAALPDTLLLCLEILDNPDEEYFSDPKSNHKRRSFYRNISGDEDHVTVDMWAIRAAMGEKVYNSGKIDKKGNCIVPFDSPAPNTYNLFVEAYREAASRLREEGIEITPARLQAATWTSVKYGYYDPPPPPGSCGFRRKPPKPITDVYPQISKDLHQQYLEEYQSYKARQQASVTDVSFGERVRVHAPEMGIEEEGTVVDVRNNIARVLFEDGRMLYFPLSYLEPTGEEDELERLWRASSMRIRKRSGVEVREGRVYLEDDLLAPGSSFIITPSGEMRVFSEGRHGQAYLAIKSPGISLDELDRDTREDFEEGGILLSLEAIDNGYCLGALDEKERLFYFGCNDFPDSAQMRHLLSLIPYVPDDYAFLVEFGEDIREFSDREELLDYLYSGISKSSAYRGRFLLSPEGEFHQVGSSTYGEYLYERELEELGDMAEEMDERDDLLESDMRFEGGQGIYGIYRDEGWAAGSISGGGFFLVHSKSELTPEQRSALSALVEREGLYRGVIQEGRQKVYCPDSESLLKTLSY